MFVPCRCEKPLRGWRRAVAVVWPEGWGGVSVQEWGDRHV
jgi:hypothetical protein